MSAPETVVRTNEPPKLRMLKRARELWRNREILANLAKKELRVKYKSTALGVAWSMLNPLLYLVVFYVVFTVFLPNEIDNFPIYLLSGLLPWTLFSASMLRGTEVIVSNAQLVSKVYFPREVLPLSVIGANLVNFGTQFAVLIAVMLALTYPFLGPNLLLLLLALVVLLLFTAAVITWTSAWNVRYRDITYIVELAMLAWFWGTPIVYPIEILPDRIKATAALDVYLLNPLTNIVLGFQRALYGGTEVPRLPTGELVLPTGEIGWYALRLGAVGLVSLVLLYLAWRTFFRLSGDFAEEL